MNTPNTPDEIRRYADSIRIRSAHTDTAVLTGRLDGDAPSVVKARAFLDGFEAGPAAAARGAPTPPPRGRARPARPRGAVLAAERQPRGLPRGLGAALGAPPPGPPEALPRIRRGT